jgi:hypothetical protein
MAKNILGGLAIATNYGKILLRLLRIVIYFNGKMRCGTHYALKRI